MVLHTLHWKPHAFVFLLASPYIMSPPQLLCHLGNSKSGSIIKQRKKQKGSLHSLHRQTAILHLVSIHTMKIITSLENLWQWKNGYKNTLNQFHYVLNIVATTETDSTKALDMLSGMTDLNAALSLDGGILHLP